MITGTVSASGTPTIQMVLEAKTWDVVVDTGFNGFLELPLSLKTALNPQYLFDSVSILAAGQTVVEQLFEVHIVFDGQPMMAEVTFVPGSQILLGTAMLKDHRLDINFRTCQVVIDRVP
jgi:clan AA aspartic protease